MKNDRASAHNNLGLSYFEKGEFEDALIHYSKAISLEPTAVHFNNRGLANYHINR
jgi:tetratricopeptide (TPR) repeat protein